MTSCLILDTIIRMTSLLELIVRPRPSVSSCNPWDTSSLTETDQVPSRTRLTKYLILFSLRRLITLICWLIDCSNLNSKKFKNQNRGWGPLPTSSLLTQSLVHCSSVESVDFTNRDSFPVNHVPTDFDYAICRLIPPQTVNIVALWRHPKQCLVCSSLTNNSTLAEPMVWPLWVHTEISIRTHLDPAFDSSMAPPKWMVLICTRMRFLSFAYHVNTIHSTVTSTA